MPERNLDFDTIHNRHNTRSLKFDFAQKRGMPKDILPLWVADMDFRTSSYVEDALIARAKHGIFGYTEKDESYFEAVKQWFMLHHQWTPKEEWLVTTPGVVFALSMAVKAFTKEGDGVLLQSPVYYPFYDVIEKNNRKVICNPLVLGSDHRYHMDLDDFEKKIVEKHVKLCFLCSPHNPVGRVWTREELEAFAQICVRHGVIIVSDEIHADFAVTRKHCVLPSLSNAIAEQCVLCTAPSKTFNLAGMLHSNIFIPNRRLRHAFRRELDAAGTSQLSTMGYTACEAAYRHGEEWYQAMLTYCKENIAFLRHFVETRLAPITLMPHEGTYLLWLDFRELPLSSLERENLIVHRAKLWLDRGEIFGKGGEGFERINIATQRTTLTHALERLEAALFTQ